MKLKPPLITMFLYLKGKEHFFTYNNKSLNDFLKPNIFDQFIGLEKAKENSKINTINKGDLETEDYNILKYSTDKIKENKTQEEKKVEKTRNKKGVRKILKN